MSGFHLKSYESWSKESLLWSTQFNDLRAVSSLEKEDGKRRRQLLRELKHHALFFECTIIRDADLINHLELQDLIREGATFIKLLESGAFVLALRDNIHNFSVLNKQTGKRRAFPEKCEQAAEPLKRIDNLVEKAGWPVLVVPFTKDQDEFRRLLGRLGQFELMNHGDKQLLDTAIQHALTQSEDGVLRFGNVYRHLMKQRGILPSSELIAYCRTAHSLTMPSLLGISPSTTANDMNPSVVIHLLAKKEKPIGDASQWASLFPRTILTEDALDILEFERIAGLRKLGYHLGYFKAVADVQRSIGSEALFHKTFTAYLGRLAEYLKAMRVEYQVQLAPWQKDAVVAALKRQEDLRLAANIAIPIVAGATVSTFAPAASPGVGAATAGVLKLGFMLKDRIRPNPLIQMKEGAVVPAGTPVPSKQLGSRPEDAVKRRVDSQLEAQRRRQASRGDTASNKKK